MFYCIEWNPLYSSYEFSDFLDLCVTLGRDISKTRMSYGKIKYMKVVI